MTIHIEFSDEADKLTKIKAAEIVLHIKRETALHIEYCEGFGMTKAQIEASEESQGTHVLWSQDFS